MARITKKSIREKINKKWNNIKDEEGEKEEYEFVVKKKKKRRKQNKGEKWKEI
jgi:hypothetical protein